MLDSWGSWARDDTLGGGRRKGVLHEAKMLGGLGWLFTEGELLVIDRLIAGLPKTYKRTLKDAHLHRRSTTRGGATYYAEALQLLGERLADAERAGDLDIEFLDRSGGGRKPVTPGG